jgi:3-oxoacyl-[acyl-carrier protein] reductase
MELGLEGRVALVMGASRGIGRGIAGALVREGARVALASRSEERIDEAAAELGEAATGFVADAADLERLAQLPLEVAEKVGPIDILVANTGGPPPGGALDHGFQEWEQAYASLVLAPRILAGGVLPGMQARKWGRIVNVGSTTTIEVNPALNLSNAHRMAAVGFLKTLSREVAGDGVTVNTVATGRFATDRMAELGGSIEQVEAAAREEVPAGRLGTVEEYGDLVAFLCSERAAYITGTVIPIDGGLLRSRSAKELRPPASGQPQLSLNPRSAWLDEERCFFGCGLCPFLPPFDGGGTEDRPFFLCQHDFDVDDRLTGFAGHECPEIHPRGPRGIDAGAVLRAFYPVGEPLQCHCAVGRSRDGMDFQFSVFQGRISDGATAPLKGVDPHLHCFARVAGVRNFSLEIPARAFHQRVDPAEPFSFGFGFDDEFGFGPQRPLLRARRFRFVAEHGRRGRTGSGKRHQDHSRDGGEAEHLQILHGFSSDFRVKNTPVCVRAVSRTTGDWY